VVGATIEKEANAAVLADGEAIVVSLNVPNRKENTVGEAVTSGLGRAKEVRRLDASVADEVEAMT